jgi:hypothetical protein
MRDLFLISEHENVAFELTDEILVHRTHSELGIADAQKVDGLTRRSVYSILLSANPLRRRRERERNVHI